MKKRTLNKLVKKALLEVLIEQKPENRLTISPETLSKLREGLNIGEQQEINNFFNKKKKTTISEQISNDQAEKIYKFLIKKSRAGVPLEKISNDLLLKDINIDGLGVIYKTLPTMTLEEFIFLVPDLTFGGGFTDCSSFTHPNGLTGQQSYGSITVYEGSCTAHTINDAFICCSGTNPESDDTSILPNPLYFIQITSFPSGQGFQLAGNQNECMDPNDWDGNGGEISPGQFTFDHFELYATTFGNSGLASLCGADPDYCLETGADSGCVGCAHEDSGNYVLTAQGCDSNGYIDDQDISCCQFQGCGAIATIPSADNPGFLGQAPGTIELTSSNGSTAVADETMPYWTNSGDCTFSVGCTQQNITIESIPHQTSNYDGTTTVIGGPPGLPNYDYQGGISPNPSEYDGVNATAADPSECNINVCADNDLDPINGPNGAILASQGNYTTNFVVGEGTYGGGTSQYTVTDNGSCTMTACLDAGNQNSLNQSDFQNVDITNDPDLCVANITGCGTATTTANGTGTNWSNYNLGGTVVINNNNCYYEGCIDPLNNNNVASNYICTIYPYMCDVSGPTGIPDLSLPEIQNASIGPFTHDQTMCCDPGDTPDCSGDCSGNLNGTGVDGFGTDCNGICGGPAEFDDCSFCHETGLTTTTDEINACHGCMNPNDTGNYDLAHTSDPNNECVFENFCLDEFNNFNVPSNNYVCDFIPSLCDTNGPNPLLNFGPSAGCIYEIVGCMDNGSFNTTWGSIGPFVYDTNQNNGFGGGAATNYNPNATVPCDGDNSNEGIEEGPDGNDQTLTINPQGVCCEYNPGCTWPGYVNYNNQFVQDDGLDGPSSTYCGALMLDGCTNPGMTNYEPNATSDDGSCVYEGCVDSGVTSPGSVSIWENYVCLDTTSITEQSTGIAKERWEWLGCTQNNNSGDFNTTLGQFIDGPAINPPPFLGVSFVPTPTGVFDSTAGVNNYDPLDLTGTMVVGSCNGYYLGDDGCVSDGTGDYFSYNLSTVNLTLTGPNAWSPYFSTNNGSCQYYGCKDPNAENYFCNLNPSLCVSLTSGTVIVNSAYGTLDETENMCKYPQTWDCGYYTGCVEQMDGTGEYSTLSACENACISYTAVCDQNTGCSDPGDGSGTIYTIATAAEAEYFQGSNMPGTGYGDPMEYCNEDCAYTSFTCDPLYGCSVNVAGTYTAAEIANDPLTFTTLFGTQINGVNQGDGCQANCISFDCDPEDRCIDPGGGTGQFISDPYTSNPIPIKDICEDACNECSKVESKECLGSDTRDFPCLKIDNEWGDNTINTSQQTNLTSEYGIGQYFDAPTITTSLEEQYSEFPSDDLNSVIDYTNIGGVYEVTDIEILWSTQIPKLANSATCYEGFNCTPIPDGECYGTGQNAVGTYNGPNAESDCEDNCVQVTFGCNLNGNTGECTDPGDGSGQFHWSNLSSAYTDPEVECNATGASGGSCEIVAGDVCCGCGNISGPEFYFGFQNVSAINWYNDPNFVPNNGSVCGFSQYTNLPIVQPCIYSSEHPKPGLNPDPTAVVDFLTGVQSEGKINEQAWYYGTGGAVPYNANTSIIQSCDVQDVLSSCFIGDTLITMPDNTTRRIDELKVDEIVKSKKETSKIQSIDIHEGEFDLYSINGSKHFVTEDHPFQTTEGWKAITPDKTQEKHQIEAFVLKVGDILIKDNEETEEILTLEKSEEKISTTTYNLRLDNEHVYYANNYLVHNGGVKRRIPLSEKESFYDILKVIGKKGKKANPNGGEEIEIDKEKSKKENTVTPPKNTIPKDVLESRKLRNTINKEIFNSSKSNKSNKLREAIKKILRKKKK